MAASPEVIYAASPFTEQDVYLFREGRHSTLYDRLGAHLASIDGVPGARFAVWAPNAESVTVIGDFNDWHAGAHPLRQRDDGSGIWEGFIGAVGRGALYKYRIRSRYGGYEADKGDPFACRWEVPPGTASVVWDTWFEWGDGEWMGSRRSANAHEAPWSIYEVHLGSWRRVPEEGSRFLTYREMAVQLPAYARDAGFTHVELLPVMEHPFYGSWGYQTIGYFAPTARYGTPQDLMYLIEALHQGGLGVILDWVPSHFPGDEHGLAYFDGTYLYEHADPKQGYHPQWNSYIFNHGRPEVRSVLTSSAMLWLERYHADALRVDAVASMLYLDYGRAPGEWIPNRFGGRENLEAIRFLRELNEAVYVRHPDVQLIAEESTAWPMVSRPGYVGGLGFGMKWNMGWMHDSLQYMERDPAWRSHHHGEITFSFLYAFSENFMLPISHDEVVHGKGSLLHKMPGDQWRRLANLRLLFGYMWAHPGKKLLFMGGEFGQWNEWYHEHSLDWHLLEQPAHQGVRRWVEDLNRLYRTEPALHERDFSQEGFEWVDFRDAEQSTLSFLRRGRSTGSLVLVVANFTPVPRPNYRLGVPRGGVWQEVLNSDARLYGGSGYGSLGSAESVPIPCHGRYESIVVTLPPLAIVFFRSPG